MGFRIKEILLVSTFWWLASCGIEIRKEHSHRHDYVTLNIAYIDEFGSYHLLKTECVDLDGAEDRARISIHNYEDLHDIKIDWRMVGSQFRLKFYEGFGLVHSTFYQAESFRSGLKTTVNLNLDEVTYKVDLMGPYCRGV